MTQDASRYVFSNAGVCHRAVDRRLCTQFQTPPYQTSHGLVTADRRRCLDRRASWLREYALDLAQA